MGDRPTQQSERLERRALERDLVAQLSPDLPTQQRNEETARRLRELLAKVKLRRAED